jgi:hypothetical protein
MPKIRSKWFGRNKTAQCHPLPDTVTRTNQADTIAGELLGTMRQMAANKRIGEQLSYDIPEDKMVVQPIELTLSLMQMASDYGLRLDSLALGTINCTKI